MKAMVSTHKMPFGEVKINKSERKLLELSKLTDEDLYTRMGVAGRQTVSSVKPGNVYLESMHRGDVEGKSPTFFRDAKIELPAPVLYYDPKLDDLEGGRMLFRSLEEHFDRLICETVSNSPLSGYKQEAIRLAELCVKAIERKYPEVDKRVVETFVAIRMKGLFAVCTRY